MRRLRARLPLRRSIGRAFGPVALVALAASAGAQAQPVVVEAGAYGVVVDATRNNGPALQRALDAAGYQQRRAPGRTAHVVLPCHAPFATTGQAIGYLGQTFIPDSVALVGCGGAEVVDAVDDRGHAYRPVREVATRGARESRLRVLDGAVYSAATGPVVTRFGVAPGVTWLALRDLVLDGNWAGNLDAYRAIPEPVLKPLLQDGNGWAALVLDGSAGRPVCRPSTVADGPLPVRVELRRVAITGYGANSVVGTTCVAYDGEAVRLGSTLHNHVFYGGNARFRSLTLEGFAWTHMVVMADVDVEGLVYEAAGRNPSGRWNPELINVRSGLLTVREFHVDTRFTAPGDAGGHVAQLFRTDYGRVDLSGFVWLSGPAGSLGSVGDGGVVRHGRLHADRTESLLGGLYHSAPPRDGNAHVYVEDVEVSGPLGELLADRGTYPTSARLDRVRASGLFVLGGPNLSVTGVGAVALTNSALRLDPAAGVHTGGRLMSDGRGAYLTPPTICADASTRRASGLTLATPAAAHCRDLLRAAIPPPPVQDPR